MAMTRVDARREATKRIAPLLGMGVAVAGLLVLVGWSLDIAWLKSLLPGLPTMKPNTALGFVLLGASLRLSLQGRGSRPAGYACAFAAGAIGALTLLQYAFETDLSIDDLLFTEPAQAAGSGLAGRMAVMTAMNLLLCAVALALQDWSTRQGRRPGNWLLFAVALNSLLAVLGYLYGVDALYRVAAMSAMALPTALLFLLLALGITCARPDSRFVSKVIADDPGGWINRRLLPAAILLPPFLGWLRWMGEKAGYYDGSFGLAVFAISNVILFLALAWWSAGSLRRSQEQRDALSRSSDWQQAILNSADFTVVSTDIDGTIRSINAGAAAMLGYRADELVDLHTPGLFHDADEVAARARVLSTELGRHIAPGFEVFVAKARDGGADDNDWTYVCRDGRRVPVRLSVTALRDTTGRLTGFLGIGRDITAQAAAEASLRESEERLRTITDNLPALISYIDADRRFRFNNATYEHWLGVPLAQISGRRLDEVYASPIFELIAPHVERAFKGETTRFEFASSQSGRSFSGTYIPDRDATGRVLGVYGLINDVTVQKAAETTLRHLSEVDGLTGLPNRRQFEVRLAQAIARSEAKAQAMAVIFLDVDQFKAINDSLGHEGGDKALQEVARRLVDSARSSDTVARLAGDEFVLILEGLAHPMDAEAVARKIVDALARPFDIDGGAHRFSASLGVAIRRPDEMDAAALLRRADEALYRVKKVGRGTYELSI